MEAIHKVTYKSHKIEIYWDDEAFYPREDYEECCLSRFWCSHKRYRFPAEAAIIDNGFRSWEDVEGAIFQDFDPPIIFPVHMLDHSMQYFQLGAFTVDQCGEYARWDAGQIGYIFTTKQLIRKHFGIKRITKAYMEEATRIVKAEFDAWKDYAEGNCYGYVIHDEAGEEVESCWGFLGDYDGEYGALTEAKAIIDAITKNNENKEMTNDTN